ncbi:hypothetical protein [Hymenobacter arizonensis]|uniref:Uncharacterized protein n=1 Tax=Hymenobacter arizonensis TaxID=1227077 RepID=A0A1I5UFE5_HYMAR|nr:hypothetical protein [Hymenobacter arizonensis]SFP94010.1 hypothetical protein SAMN04515668_0900 [Hymenobacter arizonensis]
MEKVYTLLWILIGIGVFVFRLIAKARENTARESQERPRRPGNVAPELPTATFQELLKQMQSRNAGEPSTEAPVPAPRPAETLPQPTAPRTPGGRKMPRETARPARSQERTTVRQVSLEAPATARPHTHLGPPIRRSAALPRASSETPALRNRQPTDAPAVSPLNETVRQMLARPESARAAFILGEIFQRKY